MSEIKKVRSDEELQKFKDAAMARAMVRYADRIAALRKSEGPNAVLPITWMGGEYEWMSRAERRRKNVRRG